MPLLEQLLGGLTEDELVLHCGMRVPLTESAYRIPINPETAFFDFYGLYALWFKGEGWRDYGYANAAFQRGEQHVSSERHDEVIRDALWNATVEQAKRLLSGIYKAIPDELSHVYDEHLIEPSEVHKWGKANEGLYQKLLRGAPTDSVLASSQWYSGGREVASGGAFWDIFTVSDVAKIFEAPFWRSLRSDLFGGKPWAAITRQFGLLLEAYKGKKLKDLILEIDKTYDLEHNTGDICSKIPKRWRVSMAALDMRAKLGTFDQWLPFVSPFVAAQFKRNLRLSESVPNLREMRKAVSELADTSLVESLLAVTMTDLDGIALL